VPPRKRRTPTISWNETVEVYYLPEGEADEAWRSRFELWEDAPFHDELWDGYMQDFRIEPLTFRELTVVLKEYKWRRRLPSSVFAMLYLKKNKKMSAADEVEIFKEKRRRRRSSRSPRRGFSLGSISTISEAELEGDDDIAGTEEKLDEHKEVKLNEDLHREKERIRSSLQRRSRSRQQKALDLERRDGGGHGDDESEAPKDIFTRTIAASANVITELLWGSEQNLPTDDVDDEDEFEEADELFAYDQYMERLKRLDGLGNTNVRQTGAANSMRLMLLNAYNKLFNNE